MGTQNSLSAGGVLQGIGSTALLILQILGEAGTLFFATWQRMNARRRTRDRVLTQMVRMGTDTLPLAALVSLFTGMVLVVQAADQLEQFTQEILGSIVGLAMTRELGPVIMGFLLAGRAGSSVAAELGSMSVYEEIHALRTMDIDPIEFLSVPRFVAMTVALPVLILYANVIGILGGALVVLVDPAVKIGVRQYFDNLTEWVTVTDVIVGLLKGVAFGMIVATISCTFGFRTRGGAEGIAISTTAAVVWSFVLIIVVDFLIVRLALYL